MGSEGTLLKPTFVNALLQRTVMSVDQQPCTTVFCEVHNFLENNNVEEVHIIKDVATYNTSDRPTYKRALICSSNRTSTTLDFTYRVRNDFTGPSTSSPIPHSFPLMSLFRKTLPPFQAHQSHTLLTP